MLLKLVLGRDIMIENTVETPFQWDTSGEISGINVCKRKMSVLAVYLVHIENYFFLTHFYKMQFFTP